MDIAKTFKSKRVFITGHTGFKGAWLSIWLQQMGAELKGYSLKAEKESLFNKVKSKLEIDSVISDIRNQKRLRKEILKFNPDFIFHMAAQPLVLESYKDPVYTFDVNAMGTAHVLDALRYLEKKCICVVVTTDKVYQNMEINHAYVENDKLGGHDPYSASKASAEITAESFRLSFFNPADFSSHKKVVSTARAGNVIGGGDFAKDRIIPDIFRAFSTGRSIKIRNPKSVRPWQHVLEPLHGYLKLAAAMKTDPVKFAAAYNFGPALKDTFTVENLVKLAVKNWKSGSFEIANQKKSLHEAGLLMLNIEKSAKELNWKPRWNGETAIAKTINWYKKSLTKNADAFQLCENDINDYLRKEK